MRRPMIEPQYRSRARRRFSRPKPFHVAPPPRPVRTPCGTSGPSTAAPPSSGHRRGAPVGRLAKAAARASASPTYGYPPRPRSRRLPLMVNRCTQWRLRAAGLDDEKQRPAVAVPSRSQGPRDLLGSESSCHSLISTGRSIPRLYHARSSEREVHGGGTSAEYRSRDRTSAIRVNVSGTSTEFLADVLRTF